jgi:hypothetical protein
LETAEVGHCLSKSTRLGGQSFDRLHWFVDNCRQRYTRQHCPSADKHSAGTTFAPSACLLGTGEAQIVAQNV